MLNPAAMRTPSNTPRNLSGRQKTPRTPRHSVFGKQTLAPPPTSVCPIRARTRAPRPPGHPSVPIQHEREPGQADADRHGQPHTRYRRKALLHQKGVNKTFLAVDGATGEEVFVREICRQKTREGASEGAQRLACEVNVLRQLQDCPNVAKYKEKFDTEDSLVVVTEASHGTTIRQALETQRTFSENGARRIARDILQMLDACEKNNIIHGNVSPDSLWLQRIGVTQYEQAKAGQLTTKSNGDRPICASGRKEPWIKALEIGTCGLQGCRISDRALDCKNGVLYWAPEVYVRKENSKSDLWSLGVLLYESIAGRHPIWSKDQIEWIATLPKADDGLLHALLRDLLWKQLDFTSKEWDEVSQSCKSFIERLMDRSYYTRLTLSEAKQHEWFKEETKSQPPKNKEPPSISNEPQSRNLANKPGKGHRVPPKGSSRVGRKPVRDDGRSEREVSSERRRRRDTGRTGGYGNGTRKMDKPPAGQLQCHAIQDKRSGKGCPGRERREL